MGKYVIFGAGYYGERALEMIGTANVEFFLDNSEEKQRTGYLGFDVFSLDAALPRLDGFRLIVAVSEQYINEIRAQLAAADVADYETFGEWKFQETRRRLLKRIDYIEIYKKAVAWIVRNSVEGKGIINNSRLKEPYPEVTGYYIPSLIRWGYKELATSYAKWLCSIQHEDGAWYDTEEKNPYIFDTAQILKGLIAVRRFYPDVDGHIIKGCDWILSNMNEEGRLVAPVKDVWGDGTTCSELIHTYCISPVKEAGILFERPDYIEKAEKIAYYYTTKWKEKILNFDLLSHFYAYVMEAMIDIGKADLAREAMDRLAHLQKETGEIPAYHHVDWVCSTGLFQLALVWFRLGDMEHGTKAFEYACKLQNASGGWYGSYLSGKNKTESNTYFPESEISWAGKYFLDALYYKNIALFESQASMFCNSIQREDGRYRCVKNTLEKLIETSSEKVKVLDMGCGKGRYLANLTEDCPNACYYASDLSLSVMEYLNADNVEKKKGSLTDIPFEDDCFDMAYTCEALEHAVDIESAVRELCRVVRPGGKVVIIDKNKEKLGYFEIEEWEQWFDEIQLKNELLKYCMEAKVIKNINFDDNQANGLFYCWMGTVK